MMNPFMINPLLYNQMLATQMAVQSQMMGVSPPGMSMNMNMLSGGPGSPSPFIFTANKDASSSSFKTGSEGTSRRKRGKKEGKRYRTPKFPYQEPHEFSNMKVLKTNAHGTHTQQAGRCEESRKFLICSLFPHVFFPTTLNFPSHRSHLPEIQAKLDASTSEAAALKKEISLKDDEIARLKEELRAAKKENEEHQNRINVLESQDQVHESIQGILNATSWIHDGCL